MAGSLVDIIASQIDKQRLGYQALSITNFTLTTEPQIAAGSMVEISDALFEFTAAENGTGWAGIANSSLVYFKLVISGTSVTWAYTTTAPIWKTSKQGWYSGSDRVIGGCYKDSSGNYTRKWLYREDSGGAEIIRQYGDGSIEIGINSIIESHYSIVGGVTTYILPAGLYLFYCDHGGSPYGSPEINIEYYINGVWRYAPFVVGSPAPAYEAGNCVVSDGVNCRLYTALIGTFNAYLRKVA